MANFFSTETASESSDVIGKSGTVVGRSGDAVLIEFPVERCSNCHCAQAFNRHATVVSFESKDELSLGQQVTLQWSAGQLLRVSSALFGLPLFCAMFGAMFGAMIASHVPGGASAAFLASSSVQAVGAILGFSIGALASFCLREQLQIGIYERLVVRPVDC